VATKRLRPAAIALFSIQAAFCALCPCAASAGDISAASLTKLLQDRYREAHTLQAVFLERYSQGPKEARLESGTVYFQKPGRMRWDYEAPEKKVFLVDGKMSWFYVPYDHTVTREPVKQSSDWRTPLVLLTGKADLSRLCENVTLVSQPGVPPAHSVLRCIPKGATKQVRAEGRDSATGSSLVPGQDYTDALIEMDNSSGELARITIQQPGGIELEYRFGNWKTNLPLPDGLFHFEVPVGVAIVNADSLADAASKQ
jgi:outer membrane lipoprotein carrier protein